MGDFAKGFVKGIGWDSRVQAVEGVMEAVGEDDLLEGLALGERLAWGDVGAEDKGITERVEPSKSSLLDNEFIKSKHF
ncbi:MAG: hypothetical protein WAW52_14425 [Methanothrix sp.]